MRTRNAAYKARRKIRQSAGSQRRAVKAAERRSDYAKFMAGNQAVLPIGG